MAGEHCRPYGPKFKKTMHQKPRATADGHPQVPVMHVLGCHLSVNKKSPPIHPTKVADKKNMFL